MHTIVRFFQMGGLFMFPIATRASVGLAIAFERWVQLKRVQERKQKNVGLCCIRRWSRESSIKPGKWPTRTNPAMAQMLGMGLARQGAVRRREDIEIAMEESMMEIIPRLEKRTPYLALLSNIATLFGLLGTIMGLIQAFAAVATASPAEKAALLAASISEAMNCTAFGLMSAIPLLLLHARLTTTTGQIVNSLEMASVKALNTISNFAKRQFDQSPVDRSPILPSANLTGAAHGQTIS